MVVVGGKKQLGGGAVEVEAAAVTICGFDTFKSAEGDDDDDDDADSSVAVAA